MVYWDFFKSSTRKHTMTVRRKKIYTQYVSLLNELNLTEEYINFLDGDAGKTFVRESNFLIQKWLKQNKYLILNGSVLLHDSGSALDDLEKEDDFKNKSLEAIEYQSDIHHLLSPNVNKWHGNAKQKWKNLLNTRMVDKSEGVESSLLLLKCLLEVKPKHIIKYFKQNLFLNKKVITSNDITALITEDKKNIFKYKKMKESMYYFKRWRNGRLRDGKFFRVFGKNINIKKQKLLERIMS